MLERWKFLKKRICKLIRSFEEFFFNPLVRNISKVYLFYSQEVLPQTLLMFFKSGTFFSCVDKPKLTLNTCMLLEGCLPSAQGPGDAVVSCKCLSSFPFSFNLKKGVVATKK